MKLDENDSLSCKYDVMYQNWVVIGYSSIGSGTNVVVLNGCCRCNDTVTIWKYFKQRNY